MLLVLVWLQCASDPQSLMLLNPVDSLDVVVTDENGVADDGVTTATTATEGAH